MTNPDLNALANELDDIETDAAGKCNWSEVATVSDALRRLASSDSGVKVKPEPVAWAEIGSRGQALTVRPERSDFCTTPLYAAPPADAGMREALELAHGKFCKIAGTENWTDSCLDGWRRSPGALRDYAEQAAKEIDAALTAPGATTKSDGGDLPANLAEIIETELTAWRGANGGVYTIHAAALGISCAIRSAVFRANNTESDGGHGGQPYASTDAVEGASAPNATSGKQEGRTGIEVGASRTPGSSMSSGQSAPIVAGQAPGPSDPSSTRSDVTLENVAYQIRRALVEYYPAMNGVIRESVGDAAARALLDQFEIRKHP